MKKAIAEFIGTFALVLMGCGAAVIGETETGATLIDILGIAAGFQELTIVAMAYGIGQVSGCHINPAVSLGVLVAGRMSTKDFVTYVIAQVLTAIAPGPPSVISHPLRQGVWLGRIASPRSLRIPVILVSTTCPLPSSTRWLERFCSWSAFSVSRREVRQSGLLAPFAIGLTLVAIHLLGINVTGTSVNPARSLGPAIVGAGNNPHALAQVWLFIVAPLIGAGVAGYLFKSGILAAEDVIPERGGVQWDLHPAASA